MNVFELPNAEFIRITAVSKSTGDELVLFQPNKLKQLLNGKVLFFTKNQILKNFSNSLYSIPNVLIPTLSNKFIFSFKPNFLFALKKCEIKQDLKTLQNLCLNYELDYNDEEFFCICIRGNCQIILSDDLDCGCFNSKQRMLTTSGSAFRIVDHCVEFICNDYITQAFKIHSEDTVATLIGIGKTFFLKNEKNNSNNTFHNHQNHHHTMLQQAQPTSTSVLLIGRSGSGSTTLAQALALHLKMTKIVISTATLSCASGEATPAMLGESLFRALTCALQQSPVVIILDDLYALVASDNNDNNDNNNVDVHSHVKNVGSNFIMFVA
jgi:hypothetical protein